MTSGPEKPRRLGRGLEALLATRPTAAAAPTAAPGGGEGEGGRGGDSASEMQRIKVAQVRPNPFQPRKEFRAEELAELEASLRSTGLLQPITVRPVSGGGYELIAGERRLRAAQRIGWAEIPALVKEIDDRTAATLALVENLQRSDLNAVEEAEGYQRIMQEFSLTQQQVADVVGKDRTTVANTMRVLQLPGSVRRMVQDGQLTLGHARALLAVGNELRIVDLAREVVAQGMSVREVERRARESRGGASGGGAAGPSEARGRGSEGSAGGSRDPEARRIEDLLRRYLQTDVHLSVGAKQRGEIRIMFYSNDDLERVLELVMGETGEGL